MAHAMLKQRLATVAIVLPLMLAGMFLLPNPGWALLTSFAVAIGAFEWAKLAGYGRAGRIAFIAAIFGSCLVLALWSWRAPESNTIGTASTLIYLLAVLFWVGLLGWGKNAALLRLERWLFAHRGQTDTSIAA